MKKRKILILIVILIIIIIGIFILNYFNNKNSSNASNNQNINNDIKNNNNNDNNQENNIKKDNEITLENFVGNYRGIDPFAVIDWDTYEMANDNDKSTLSITKSDNEYKLDVKIKYKQIEDSFNSIYIKSENMTYKEDETIANGDLWDCLETENNIGDYSFCKRRSDNRIVVSMNIGEYTETFILK